MEETNNQLNLDKNELDNLDLDQEPDIDVPSTIQKDKLQITGSESCELNVHGITINLGSSRIPTNDLCQLALNLYTALLEVSKENNGGSPGYT